MDKNIQLIIPMSGIGRRFLEAGYIEPKPLIIVDDKPIIEHVLGLFPGVTDVTFICNEIHKGDNMINTLKRISPNCKISWVSNNNRKGPVHAVSQIFNSIDDDREVIVSYCDYGTYWDFDRFLADVRGKNLDGSIPSYIGFHPHMLGSDNYAFSKLDKNGYLEQIKEKESFTDNKMNEYASNGTYYYKNGRIMKKYFQDLMDSGISINGEYYCSLTYNQMVKDGLRVGVFEINVMLQWGTPYDLEIYKGWSDYFKKPIMQEIECPKDTTLILPMAGNGSRFSRDGYLLPKPLIPVDGVPMIIKAVNDLPKCENNVFIVRGNHVNIDGTFDVGKTLIGEYPNTRIVTIDGVTEGQACTCEVGLHGIDLEKPILISACDNGIYYDTEKCEKMLNDETIDILVWSFRNNQTSKVNPNSYAWLDVDDNDNIRYVSCKKFIYDSPLRTHAIIGTMFFRKAKYFLEGLQKNYKDNIRTNGEFYVDDVLNQNIKDGLTIKVFEVEHYICWGSPNDLRTYNYWLDFFRGNCINKEKTL